MTVELLEALAANLLEYEHLVCLGTVINDSCLDNGTLYIGGSDTDLTLIIDEEDLVKHYICTVCSREAVAKDFFSSFYLELLACNVNDCVHKYYKTYLKFEPQASVLKTALYQWLDGYLNFRTAKL